MTLDNPIQIRTLEIAYYRLGDGVCDPEIGPNQYDERRKASMIWNAVNWIEQLGYKGTIEPARSGRS